MLSSHIALMKGPSAWLLAVVLIAVGCSASPTADERVDQLLELIHLSASAGEPSLVATGAIADLGPADGAHQVRVRIVDRLPVDIEVSSDNDVTLAGAPKLCLVGPYSAPDDAGLEDRCWGEPDLSSLLAARLTPDSAGRPVLRSSNPVRIQAVLSRGDTRCDYPTGDWHVELKVDALVDGAAAGARYIPDQPFTVSLPQHGPLRLLSTTETRYCGLATLVYRQQGEPEVVAP